MSASSTRNGSLPRAEHALLAAAWADPAATLGGWPDTVSSTTAKGLEALRRGGATTSTLRDAGVSADDLSSVFSIVGSGAPPWDVAVQNLTAPPARDAAARDAGLTTLSIGACLDAEEKRLELGVEYLATGFDRLDAALGGGFAIPSLNLFGAPPKAFKSTVAQIIAEHAVEVGAFVYHLDLENGRPRALRQKLCRRARIGMKQVARALADARSGVFHGRQDVERWNEAKRWMRDTLASRYFLETTPPRDFEARIRDARIAAGDAPLFVVVDSLQKLPMDFDDRRGSVDKWIRLFERLRHEYRVVFLVVSEIRRGKEGYAPREDAFKESGGIEYAADLAMTLSRPAADEDTEAPATLRIELARDCDEDPRGEIASYRALRPFYGVEEIDPVPIRRGGRKGSSAPKRGPAEDFLRDVLADGPVHVSDVLARGKAADFSEPTLQRAKRSIGVLPCTLSLKAAWRLP